MEHLGDHVLVILFKVKIVHNFPVVARDDEETNLGFNFVCSDAAEPTDHG